jgi:protein-tyrosine phosphatase
MIAGSVRQKGDTARIFAAMKVLMVCLGNICRSPLAQGILEHRTGEKGLDWEVDSAGTGSWHVGNPPDPRSVAVAAKHGLDISRQRARQVHWPDLEAFDLVFAMDQSNYQDLMAMAKSDAERGKIRLIRDLEGSIDGLSVPDPYWDDDGFEQVYAMLDKACLVLVDQHAR